MERTLSWCFLFLSLACSHQRPKKDQADLEAMTAQPLASPYEEHKSPSQDFLLSQQKLHEDLDAQLLQVRALKIEQVSFKKLKALTFHAESSEQPPADYFLIEVCKKGQTSVCHEEPFVMTLKNYVPADVGKLMIRARACYSAIRLKHLETPCGPWSTPQEHNHSANNQAAYKEYFRQRSDEARLLQKFVELQKTVQEYWQELGEPSEKQMLFVSLLQVEPLHVQALLLNKSIRDLIVKEAASRKNESRGLFFWSLLAKMILNHGRALSYPFWSKMSSHSMDKHKEQKMLFGALAVVVDGQLANHPHESPALTKLRDAMSQAYKDCLAISR